MKKFYINPDKFKVFSNNSFRIGDFLTTYHDDDMYQMSLYYYFEVMKSNNLMFNIEEYCKPFLDKNIQENVMAYEPYETEIYVTDKHHKSIFVNHHEIVFKRKSRKLSFELIKDNKIIMKTESLLSAYNQAMST